MKLKDMLTKKSIIMVLIGFFLMASLSFLVVTGTPDDRVVYPLQEVSKLECRFEKFSNLASNCKQELPVLKTKDYKKYSQENGGYNTYTRYYSVLWGSSYKYGWDVGNGGHQGTDIATSEGTPVYSMSNGKVIVSKTSIGWGKVVSIKHNIKGKEVISNYSHLSKINVKLGERVKAGAKIGEVGNTGNSHGNHLHFQIDLDTPFHPYYYDYKACPYSYYDITEKGVCFDELSKNTIDPLLFLESAGAVLNDIEIVNTYEENSTTGKKNNFDLSIFDRTVYFGYSVSDIKKLQKIFKDLGEYDGAINGDYKDIEKYIISYQKSNNIIKNDTDEGAGWFGPKTRRQAKHDYKNFLAHGGKTDKSTSITKNNIKTEKISRRNLLTREEIEAREVDDFLRRYDIKINFKDAGNNIKLGQTRVLSLKILNRKGKGFRGTMPGTMTFVVDKTKVKIFPNKLYYFTDGRRDIKLTGLKVGNTTLYIKIGNKVIKSFSLKIYEGGEKLYPEFSQIISSKKIVIGEEKTGIVFFKDSNNSKLINIKYSGDFRLKTNSGVKVCLKSGDLKNIRKIYKRKCSRDEYKNTIDFDYEDTIVGLLLFGYKVISKNAQIEVINNNKSKSLAKNKLKVSNPKGLSRSYKYHNEIISMLEKSVVSGLNKGYFLEERNLTELDANKWIENTLNKLLVNTSDNYLKNKILDNLEKLNKERNSKSKYISRKDFLDKSYKYLIFNDIFSISIKYRDLESGDNKKANAIFDKNNTWKDKFGGSYFRPNINITRGEGAYFLSQVIEKNKQVFLTLN